jgi:hypothetical protein
MGAMDTLKLCAERKKDSEGGGLSPTTGWTDLVSTVSPPLKMKPCTKEQRQHFGLPGGC